MIDQKFGRLTVLSVFPSGMVNVACECGIEKIIRMNNIASGKATSCGCVRREMLREAAAKRELRGTKQHTTGRRAGRLSLVRKIGVFAQDPRADSTEPDWPVCYIVATKHDETLHDTFDEARVEYLTRTGRMSA